MHLEMSYIQLKKPHFVIVIILYFYYNLIIINRQAVYEEQMRLKEKLRLQAEEERERQELEKERLAQVGENMPVWWSNVYKQSQFRSKIHSKSRPPTW